MVGRLGTGRAVVREKGMQLFSYAVWGEKDYFMHCSIQFCSWFEVRMVL